MSNLAIGFQGQGLTAKRLMIFCYIVNILVTHYRLYDVNGDVTNVDVASLFLVLFLYFGKK